MKSLFKFSRRRLRVFILMFINTFITIPAYAATSVADSKIAKGTERLIQDLTTWLMVLAPVAAGLLIIYFFIMRSAADELDQKKWNNRVVFFEFRIFASNPVFKDNLTHISGRCP